jgi:AcrR family transcriptional regulator
VTAVRRRVRARRERRFGEDTRERLLRAAIGLFSERGFAATGVDAICRRAGVAKTALYWHFDSKQGLLAAVIERVGTRWIEQIRRVVDLEEADPMRRVQRALREWRRILDEEPHLIRLLMVLPLEQADRSPRTREALLRVRERAEAAFSSAVRETLGTEIPDLDMVAHTLLTLLQGAVLGRIVDRDEKRLDRALEELRRTIVLLVWSRLPEDRRPPLPPL